MTEQTNRVVKKCPACNKTFMCEHNAGCWCSVYQLTDDVKELLARQFKDCLCKDCLEKATKGERLFIQK